jgi:hypothetical protein
MVQVIRMLKACWCLKTWKRAFFYPLWHERRYGQNYTTNQICMSLLPEDPAFAHSPKLQSRQWRKGNSLSNCSRRPHGEETWLHSAKGRTECATTSARLGSMGQSFLCLLVIPRFEAWVKRWSPTIYITRMDQRVHTLKLATQPADVPALQEDLVTTNRPGGLSR